MMVYMTSKVFQDIFLVNESDQDILEAQYVLVSSRIRRKDASKTNIISAMNTLYPNAHVYSALTDKDFRERYIEQLVENETLLSALIKGSIDEKYNIIFLCTKNEGKMKYLKYLSEFIYMEFGYPVYEYSQFASGACHILKYDKEDVLKHCNRILKEAEKNDFENKMQSEHGREAIIRAYKKMKKCKLVKILKKRDLYEDNMSKKDMIDTLTLFM